MRLAGNIEDLGLGEILQIVSFSQKSGTLSLNSRKRSGTIVFTNGQIVRATSSPIKEGVGDLLLKSGILTEDTLAKAKEVQSSLEFSKNLGTILKSDFGIDAAAIEENAKKIVEKTVYSFFFWKDGSFIFELTEFEESPEVLKDDLLQYTLENGLNPQFLAMEGSRLYDEFLREGIISADGEAIAKESEPAVAEATTESIFTDAPPESSPEVSPAEPPPASTQADEFEDTVPPVAAPASAETTTPALEGTDDIPFLSGDFLKELEDEGLLESTKEAAEPRVEESRGLMLLKEMLEELSRPLNMSEIVLLILRFSSEIMTRAVVFGSKKGNIIGMGQFGIELADGNADMRVRKMQIPLNENSSLREVIDSKIKQVKPLEVSKWNDYILDEFGGIRPSEVFLAPVIVHGKVALIIYGDNAATGKEIGDTSSLEIFLAQTSIALEKLMQQKQAGLNT
jgi:hypothetical protein